MTVTATGAVVGEALQRAGTDLSASEAEQLPMFEPPSRFKGDDDRANRVREAIASAHRGRGRPPGATNRSSRRIREYLLGRGVDPLEQLMRWAMHTPETLAMELGCTKLEALRELRGMWAELAPFFHGKAVPVDDDGRPAPLFNLVIAGAGAIGPGRRPWDYLEDDQQVGDQDPRVSHARVSHVEPK